MEETANTKRQQDWRNWTIAALGLLLVILGVCSQNSQQSKPLVEGGTTATAVSLANELCTTPNEVENVVKIYYISSNTIRAFVASYRDKDVKTTENLVSKLQELLELDILGSSADMDVPATAIVSFIIARLPEPGDDIKVWLDKLEYIASGLNEAATRLSATK